jgi:hypothetical protein
MQAQDLIKYIQQPQSLSKQSIKDLQKLVKDFPYFQSAHVLLSMASKKWDASIYQQSLKKTAIVVSNRSHLFQLIHELENEVEAQKAEALVVKNEPVSLETTKAEEVKHELDILKATEVSAEAVLNTEAAPIEVIAEKVKPNAEQILEKEIASGVVNAFVEKEILKIADQQPEEEVIKKEPASFVDWLSLLKKNNGQSYAQIDKQVKEEKEKSAAAKSEQPKETKTDKDPSQQKKQKNRAIIDKIIESGPGLIRVKEEQKFFSPDNKAKESLLENEHLVTETLAKIYALQGSVNKAVRAYEILSLKFPQKSAYFANLIQKLKNNQ